MIYTVIQNIQSVRIDGNEPVEQPPVDIQFYTGTDLATAIVAIGQACLVSDPEWVKLRSVRMEVKPGPFTIEWTEDWSLPHSHAYEFGDEAYPNGDPETCESCHVRDADDNLVACLGCIDDASDEYRKQVEADLLAQAEKA